MKTRKSKLYEFLEPYLEQGDQGKIQEAKKQYNRLYKAAWRKDRRKEQKEYTTSFTGAELKELNTGAKNSGRSITAFIKESALAVSRSQLLIPKDYEKNMRQIAGLLTKNYSALERIEEHMEEGMLPEGMLEQFEWLEKQILEILNLRSHDHQGTYKDG